MATRPAFFIQNGKVVRKDYDFTWIAGLAASQKKKCALSLQQAIRDADPGAVVLDVSTRSNHPLGVRMSAFHMKINRLHDETVYAEGGPRYELMLYFDYIYIRSVSRALSADEMQELIQFTHFTDIEFNPNKSINTQAKAAAEIKLLLQMYGEIPEMDQEQFVQFHKEFVIV